MKSCSDIRTLGTSEDTQHAQFTSLTQDAFTSIKAS